MAFDETGDVITVESAVDDASREDRPVGFLNGGAVTAVKVLDVENLLFVERAVGPVESIIFTTGFGEASMSGGAEA